MCVCVSVHAAAAAVRVYMEQQDANWDTFPQIEAKPDFEHDSSHLSIFLVTFLPLHEPLCGMHHPQRISMQINLTTTEVLRCFNTACLCTLGYYATSLACQLDHFSSVSGANSSATWQPFAFFPHLPSSPHKSSKCRPLYFSH